MSRIFAYCRVSTLEQNTENQRREIEAVGFAVKFQRLIEEHISGSVAASERPGFTCLLDRMENGGSVSDFTACRWVGWTLPAPPARWPCRSFQRWQDLRKTC